MIRRDLRPCLWLLPFLLVACRAPAVVPFPSHTPGDLPPAEILTAERTSTSLPQASPSATTDAPSACLTQGSRIESQRIDSQYLPDGLYFRVYLPPCYDVSAGQRYPVVYLIHGQYYAEDQWVRLGVDRALDRLIREEGIPPFLVVMPRDPNASLMPGEDPFEPAFQEELIAWVDGHYRTLTDRRQRGIAGLSRGGGWALHIGLTDWEQFGFLGLHSPGVFWTDIPLVRSWLESIPPAELPAIFIDIGDRDFQELRMSAVWLEGMLTENGIAHEWYPFQGGHDEQYWGTHLELYLRWYAEQFQ